MNPTPEDIKAAKEYSLSYQQAKEKDWFKDCCIQSFLAGKLHERQKDKRFTKFDLERAFLAGWENKDFEEWATKHFTNY